jgi:hypothetical protein
MAESSTTATTQDQAVARVLRQARTQFLDAQAAGDEATERRLTFLMASLGAANLISNEALRRAIVHSLARSM